MAGVSSVPVQMWHGVSPVPVQTWQGASPVSGADAAGGTPSIECRSCCRHESVAAALKLDLRPSASAQSHRMDLVRACEAREIVLGVAERHAKAEVLARAFAAST